MVVLFSLLCGLLTAVHKCDENCKVCHLFDHEADECDEIVACKKGWHCLECNPPLRLWFDECLSKCGTGLFRSGSNCESCAANCGICIGPLEHECTSCKLGYKFDFRGVCVKDCPSNQYPVFVTTVGSEKCDVCHISCATCIGPWTRSCTSCADGNYLRVRHRESQSGECLEHCRMGYYRNASGDPRCTACSNKCSICESEELCTRCNDGYFLYPAAKTVWGYMENLNMYCLGRDELGVFNIFDVPTPQDCGRMCDDDPLCISFEWNEPNSTTKCSLSTSCIDIFSQPKDGTNLYFKGGAKSLQFSYCYEANVPPAQIIDIGSYLGDIAEEDTELIRRRMSNDTKSEEL